MHENPDKSTSPVSSFDERPNDSWDIESYDRYCHKQDISYTARGIAICIVTFASDHL